MLLAATESMTWVRKILPAPAAISVPVVPVKEKIRKYQPGVKKHRARVWKRKRREPVVSAPISVYEPDDGPLTDEQITQIKQVTITELPTGNLISKTSLFEDDIEPYGNDLQKRAMEVWKGENPGKTFREYMIKYNQGLISELPWHHSEHVDKLNLSDRDLINIKLGLEADNDIKAGEMKGFGIAFPNVAEKGDMFLRVDVLPSVLYKYNGVNWIKTNKNLSDSYVYDDAYINHLIEKIGSGEYDPDLLSDIERERISIKLKSQST
jgi:hypothetical protein